MAAIALALFGLSAMVLGYRAYSKFIAEQIYRLDPTFVTPAHALRDDHDYVPTKRMVLWGHHFTVVAGAAPVVWPAIAVVWGWVPAFIWIVAGTVFFATVHDMGAIWASVRNRARSMGALSDDVIGPRARTLFMIVIFLLLLMVNAVFAVAIADAFAATPGSVVPAWSAIAVALVIGVLLYKVGAGILWPTVVGSLVLYGVIFLGESMPVRLPAEVLGLAPGAQWIVLLFVYAAIASMLPVWLLLQPRGYINGVQLVVGLALMYGAVVMAAPPLVAPAFNTDVPPGSPPLAPLLFVTLACGTISGFHGLVGSGTTSKQLNAEPSVRFVGGLGALGEGSLALIALIVVSAGFASTTDWRATYHTFGEGGITAFVNGGATILAGGLGLSEAFSRTVLAVMAVLFAGTTMDAGVRLQRYIVQEWGAIHRIPLLENSYVATLAAVGACLVLAFGAGGAGGTGGLLIWPLFGTTNQLLAGLTLSVISVMLVRLGRSSRYTMVPMVFVMGTALLAALYQLWSLMAEGQYALLFLDVLIIVAAMSVVLEAVAALSRERRARWDQPSAVGLTSSSFTSSKDTSRSTTTFRM